METIDRILSLWRTEAIEALGVLRATPEELLEFLIVYPFVLSFLWTSHAVVYFVRSRRPRSPSATTAYPSYAVLVPFHNEPEGALRTAWSLVGVFPPPREVLLVDDGSARTLPDDVELPPRTRVVRLSRRGGKARALNLALRETEAELIVCLDADAAAVSRDWSALLSHFADSDVAAVTGKIWPASPKGLIERFQHLDYVAVICLIKAAESTWGSLLTVSGAFVAYRRAALRSVGGWSESTATEDIDLSWRLQSQGWRIRYESRWVGHVEMAPSFGGLWRQRRRWSMGLGRTMRDHLLKAFGPRTRQLPVATISLLNAAWMGLTLLVGGWAVAGSLAGAEQASLDLEALVQYGGAYIPLSLLVFGGQLACGAAIDGRPWRDYAALLLLAPFYPIYFWSVLFTSYLAGFPAGLLRLDDGVWTPSRRALDRRVSGVGP